MVTGDANSGKTKILERFITKSFEQESQPTIGVEFIPKNIQLNDGTTVRLQIWDTGRFFKIIHAAGSEKYRSITTGHYRGAVGAVLVYDISN